MTPYWSIQSEAGPSRHTDAPERIQHASKQSRGKRRIKKSSRLINPILPILSFLTPTFAQSPIDITSRPYPPPPSRLLPTPTPVQPRDHKPSETDDSPLVYITSVIAPTHLPTETVIVDQTILPYYLTQGSDGDWQVADNAWRLYGREAGRRINGVLIGPTDDGQILVESSLPRGWGQQSSRTSIYRVPLIAACSVILAVAIVAGIIFLVIDRRKKHRKAKRRAERQRRKALIAAGIDPNASPDNSALKEKVAELERQHRIKKRKEGHVGFARVKVKKWTHGLRRRKGREEDIKEEPEPTIEVIEPKPEEQEGGATPSLNTISSVMAGEFTDQTDPTTTDSSQPTDSSPDQSSENVAAVDSTTPYLPPEYRPASVRSYRMDEAGPSRPGASSGVAEPSSTDKTRAPGYYPAPATTDMEEAEEVVSRAEGKRPLPPPSEEEERIRHIATDDKRVLEQMRLGASAPPQMSSAEHENAGPSAPHVEVDQDGFERVELDALPSPDRPSVPLHPDLPAPPMPTIQKTASREPTDELHLVPSAPPLAAVSTASSAPSAPSAPPASDVELTMPSAPPLEMDDEDDIDATPLATVVPTTPIASAPSLAAGEEEQEHVAEDGELESEPHHPDSDRPRVFLPKYEP